MFRFEKLDVWKKSVDYANRLYAVTKSFPSDERFGLTSQLRRASVSVSSNIAEGSSRSSGADFSRFIEIAYGSLMETVTQAKISQNQKFLNDDDFSHLYRSAEEISKMLSGLRASLKNKRNSGY